ncbi:MAG TPA: rhomboid family intramembrane serine protease [Vicinamibacterales bacterium]|nr:rhomboid family intramembrane serine protease [Vicinamibacterales bacterium]
MARRYSSASSPFSFGPGPVTPAVKLLIWTNIAVFLISLVVPAIVPIFGLIPAAVVHRFYLWQPVTYLFVHGGFFHILFNMLVLWMFGPELERLWGTRFFVKYYFICGIGAAATTVFVALLPFSLSVPMYYSVTIGASGALYGLLVAYAMYYPEQRVYMYFLFPIPMKYFVLIIGAIAFFSSFSGVNNGIANFAHLGGLAVGYLYLSYLKGGGFHPLGEMKYRYLKWKINRVRRKFDVHSGGRPSDWNRRLH